MSWQDYIKGKYNYLNNETTPMKYIVWQCLFKGYKTIQLSSEYDGKCVRRYFIDCLDPNISNRKLVRRNPFSLLPNKETRHWYYYLYLKEPKIDEKFIVDVESNRNFYEMLPFQRECRLAGGMINIYNNYLQCLKILKFGLAPQILMTESKADYSKYPKTTELEKFQSYFSIVYGDDKKWKTQTLQQLYDRYDACEVIYLDVYTNLKMTRQAGMKRQRKIVYNESFGPNSTVVPNSTIWAGKMGNKKTEQLLFVEVFRNGTRSSTVEDQPNFAGTYYYTMRGSGFFMPIKNLFYSKLKNDFFSAVGMARLTEPDWGQDKVLSSACAAKGAEVFIVSNFGGNSSELIHNVDVITSLSSLVRLSPFDPRIVEVLPDEKLFSDPYIAFTKTGSPVKRQFDYTIDFELQ